MKSDYYYIYLLTYVLYSYWSAESIMSSSASSSEVFNILTMISWNINGSNDQKYIKAVIAQQNPHIVNSTRR